MSKTATTAVHHIVPGTNGSAAQHSAQHSAQLSSQANLNCAIGPGENVRII